MSADEWSGISAEDRLKEARRVCPDGYAVVPREPTEAMLSAGYDEQAPFDEGSARDVWMGMLDAALK